MRRRHFLATASAAAAAAAPQAAAPVRFGIDLFSIRSQGWSPFQYLDYCAKWNAKVVHFSEIRFLGGLDEAHLKKVRDHASRLGVSLELGMRSICPSSKAFDAAQGTAEEQLTRMIRAAKVAGSPIVRTFLGTMADRTGPIPIEGHIENTVKVLRSVRSIASGEGIRIAIENHAGDMQARELKTLIEGAGQDFTGVCLDSGNPLWVLEDPHLTLETLAPYVLTSHVRDTAVWREKGGIAVKWTRLGEGNIGIREYARKFQELCPGRPFSLEIIVTQPRIFAIQEPKFWEAYRSVPAWEFARFLALADRGQPFQGLPPASKEQAAQREREDLEASVRFARDELKVV
ncbi:MAG: sugar phosphate isomerase/epimerase family protein [Bryobacteraceae bacterium]